MSTIRKTNAEYSNFEAANVLDRPHHTVIDDGGDLETAGMRIATAPGACRLKANAIGLRSVVAQTPLDRIDILVTVPRLSVRAKHKSRSAQAFEQRCDG